MRWRGSHAPSRRSLLSSRQFAVGFATLSNGRLAAQDSLPEWSKGVDSSSTSESCVGSNPTAVIRFDCQERLSVREALAEPTRSFSVWARIVHGAHRQAAAQGFFVTSAASSNVPVVFTGSQQQVDRQVKLCLSLRQSHAPPMRQPQPRQTPNPPSQHYPPLQPPNARIATQPPTPSWSLPTRRWAAISATLSSFSPQRLPATAPPPQPRFPALFHSQSSIRGTSLCSCRA